MAMLSAMTKAISLSPRHSLASIVLRGSTGISNGILLVDPTRSFSKSAGKTKVPQQQAEDKVFSNDDTNKLANSNKMILDKLKPDMLASNKLSSLNLGGFPVEIEEIDAQTTQIVANNDLGEVVTIEVDLSEFYDEDRDYSKEDVPFTFTVTKDHDGVKYDNHFDLSLSSNEIVVDNMSIKKSPSPDDSSDQKSNDSSSSSDNSDDSSSDSSDDSSSNSSDDSSSDSSDDSSSDSSDDSASDSSDDSSSDSDTSDDSSNEAEKKSTDKNTTEVKAEADFDMLDEGWQEGVRSYIKARGIEAEKMSSLIELIINKKKTKDSEVWKNKFMEKFLN